MNTSERNVTVGSVSMPGLVDLQKFMLSYRYHIAAFAIAPVSPPMTRLMLWITSFNRCRTSLSLLLSNVFLKVTAVNFKADFINSGAFQYLVCSVGAPPTCTSSTINFRGVVGPFLDEVCSSSIV